MTRADMNLVVVSIMLSIVIAGGRCLPYCLGSCTQTVSACTLLLKLPPVRRVLLDTCGGGRCASQSWQWYSRAVAMIAGLAFLLLRSLANS